MILRDAIDEYIAWQRAHGSKFTSGAGILKRILKTVDGRMDSDAVGVAEVSAFLSANGRRGGCPLTKHSALAGFYRCAIARGCATRSPLPDRMPKPPSAPPCICSRDELRRLFDCIDDCRRTPVQFDAGTFRMLLLLLYGAGLRIGEARHLSLADVDLATAILTVRDTKFYKSPSSRSVRNSPMRSRPMRPCARSARRRRGVIRPFLQTGTERRRRKALSTTRSPSRGAPPASTAQTVSAGPPASTRSGTPLPSTG